MNAVRNDKITRYIDHDNLSNTSFEIQKNESQIKTSLPKSKNVLD